MKIISCSCPKCHANLQVDVNKGNAFCNYCGTQVLFDDMDFRSEHKQIIHDDAAILRAENERQKIEYEHEEKKKIQRQKISPLQQKILVTLLWIGLWLLVKLLYKTVFRNESNVTEFLVFLTGMICCIRFWRKG